MLPKAYICNTAIVLWVPGAGEGYEGPTCLGCALTCRMNESCSTITAMVCHGQLSMERSGCSTRAIRSTSPCPSMTYRPGWAHPASLSLTAQLPGSLSTPSRLLQSRRRRLVCCQRMQLDNHAYLTYEVRFCNVCMH